MPPDPKESRALRQKAEKALQGVPEQRALTSVESDLQKLVHELSVHKIELETQNEELRGSREQLEASRSEYAELYDFAPVGYLTLDERGLITRANLTACGLLGIEGSLLLNKPFGRFICPESQDLFSSHIRKVAEATTAQACQLVLKRRDGTLFDARLESVAARVFGTTAIRTVLTDITELKQAEGALRESEKRYHTLFDAIDEGFCLIEVIFDEKGKPIDYRFLEVNAAFEKQTGLIDAQGKRMRELAPKHEEHWFEIYGRIALTGQPARFENRAEQLHRWYDVYAFRYGQPEKRQVAILFNDITGRKEDEEAIRRQAGLLELAYNAIIVRDLSGRITFWNARAEELYGFTRKEALGQVIHTLLQTRFPEPSGEHMAALTTQGRWEGEITHTTKDGRQLMILSRQALQRDETGRPVAVMEINLDMTEQRRIEAELRQAQKMEALGTLSGGVAHGFNNLLAAIIGFTELVAGHAAKGSRDARHLERIIEAGIRGRELVRQLLAFIKKAEQEKKPLRLSSIVKETVTLLRATTPTTISIKVNTIGQSALILGDPTQIQQVIMNLCTNAIYAMQEKGGRLDIELSEQRVLPSNGDPHEIDPGRYVKLIVRDTGIGISADIIDKIFDPFFTTKGLAEGVGLGLSVVHGIVKQHDGFITVISDPGRGSTFTLYFPEISEEQRIEGPEDVSIPTGSERILFVDDEEAIVEMGEDILAELGYDITSRMSSRGALELFRLDPSRFDLVITDQTMPEMTGIDLAREIFAIRADMPIIMCTGFSHLVDADKAAAAGIRAFAMKPLTKREIARTIRRVLDE